MRPPKRVDYAPSGPDLELRPPDPADRSQDESVRLARLNSGRYEPEVFKEFKEKGEWGVGVRRVKGARYVIEYYDLLGRPYVDPIGVELPAALEQHPAFAPIGDPSEIQSALARLRDYATAVLERYGLPTPQQPHYFWEDSQGKIASGPERPTEWPFDDRSARIEVGDRFASLKAKQVRKDAYARAHPGEPVAALWEPMASRWVRENIKRQHRPEEGSDPNWSGCWEAIYASELIDLLSRDGGLKINGEVQRSADWEFVKAAHFGMLLMDWRAALLHTKTLEDDRKRRHAARDSIRRRNRERRTKRSVGS
jgi:hypothetical protein